MPSEILFDGRPLRLDDIAAIARREARARLSDTPEFVRRIDAGADFIARLLAEDGVVYGVTTGYGDSCTVSIPPALVAELPRHLYTYHGIGAGPLLAPEQAPSPAGRLNPAFDIGGERFVMVTQFAGAIGRRELGPKIASLAAHDREIMNALDVLLTGV